METSADAADSGAVAKCFKNTKSSKKCQSARKVERLTIIMKVPSFKTKKIRSDILKLVDLAPTRSMYDIVLRSIDYAMDELSFIRDLIISDGPYIKKALKAWDDAFEKFGEREAYYYQAFLESEDRSVVDAPLFNGKYGNWDFDPIPKWPDIETPWRLANDLSTIAATAGFEQKFLNDLERRFKDIISDFWLKKFNQ